MGSLGMETDSAQQLSADPLPFARSYQLEALERAIKGNTIVFLETGSGKTLIAIMLLRSYSYLLRKPSPYLAIVLVPQVVLVSQQGEAVKMHTDLKVGMYWGEMGVDFWDASKWKKEQEQNEVLVMTPAILLAGLRHCFFSLSMIKILIFDECHHAIGRDPYACIMQEFYHPQLCSNSSHLPRILGLTASLINSKGSSSGLQYWQKIMKLENILNSKVYTCVNESVLGQYIPFSTLELVTYEQIDIPYSLSEHLAIHLENLKKKHEGSLENLKLQDSSVESIRQKLSKLYTTFLFCLDELGVWMAVKAAESLAFSETSILLCENVDFFGQTIVRRFCSDVVEIFSAYLPSGSGWSIGDDIEANVNAGYLTSKVKCLIECLLQYKDLKDLRCIVFVERVITSVALHKLLCLIFHKLTGWKTQYIAGNNTRLQSQSRNLQNQIVEDFRKGYVNIICATSILEEGVDVQSCNLVIRFDPSSNVCSFIQSRGRARMQNSVFLLMVKRQDSATLSRVKNYLSCGNVMREESLRHAAEPCAPLDMDLYDDTLFRVESTGAVVTLSSSVGLIYFYCSRLPSDGFFKPSPICSFDEANGVCTLYLPKSCPLDCVRVQGDHRILKKFACLEACKKLYEIGELTDNLVPKIVVEEAIGQETENEPYNDKQTRYIPNELIGKFLKDRETTFHCYLIELWPQFENEIETQNIVLAVGKQFEFDVANMDIELWTDSGKLTVRLKYTGVIHLSPEQVLVCRIFQRTLLRILLDHNLNRAGNWANGDFNDDVVEYLLLPSTCKQLNAPKIDWKTVASVVFSCQKSLEGQCACFCSRSSKRVIHTKSGLVCSCMLQDALVCTPHNGELYCISGFLDELNGNSLLLDKGTYREYFESRHDIKLKFLEQALLRARHIFPVQNCLQSFRNPKTKGSTRLFVELPPELCEVVMSPLSIRTLYSFTFAPSILHRIESLILADNLKRLHLDHCMQNVALPTFKVLEALTTKKCQEAFHLESLETLGDSFLKYASCQYLFKTHQNHHEGLLSAKKDRIICNAALCKFGCLRKLPGFIRNEIFDPQKWIVPGEHLNMKLEVESLSSTRKIYVSGRRKVKSKTVADVVEALIGAYLSTGGERAALLFMDWLGIKVDFVGVPYERPFVAYPERLVNIEQIQHQLNYSFHDPTLLVEALTHGSYMLPEIPRCYQRLEFLGDSVLDYAITMHMYNKYPGMSPGLLTDLRSASVNNDCYAQSAVRAALHKYILHASPVLHRHIVETVSKFNENPLDSTFGWESEAPFPKVLGDIIESLAGAILVDSGYNVSVVFNSIKPLLEPMITPDTVRYHPVRELNELCQKQHYHKKSGVSYEDGKLYFTVEVEANNGIYKHKCTSADKKTAEKVACKEVLKALESAGLRHPS